MESEPPWLRRPPFCVEANCELVLNASGLTQKDIDDGHSGICCGKIIDPTINVFTYNKALHRNYVYLCIYTPFKGWLKFGANRADLEKFEVCMKRLREKMGWSPAQRGGA